MCELFCVALWFYRTPLVCAPVFYILKHTYVVVKDLFLLNIFFLVFVYCQLCDIWFLLFHFPVDIKHFRMLHAFFCYCCCRCHFSCFCCHYCCHCCCCCCCSDVVLLFTWFWKYFIHFGNRSCYEWRQLIVVFHICIVTLLLLPGKF